MMRKALAALVLVGIAGSTACTTQSSSQSQVPQLNGRPAPDVCAGDPWLGQLLGGEGATLSSSMWLNGMQTARAVGAPGPAMNRIEMDYLYEFQQLRFTSAETFEFDSGQPNTPNSKVTIIRQAFGDPRSLREGNTPLYGNPIQLSPTTTEYPSSQEAATQDIAFRPRGGRTLFTFNDGTWVRVDAWMAQRVRAAFAGGPPPRPSVQDGIAWEICARRAGRTMSTEVWGVMPDRAVLHILGNGRDPDLEMFFRFSSQQLAMRAQGEQQVRCQQNRPVRDKGIFSLTPPCQGVVSSTVEGPYLHYVIRSSGLPR